MSSAPTDFITNLQVIAEDGVTYQLYGGAPARFIALDGVGIPPMRRILQKSPTQHGATDKGFRLEPRRMTLTLYIDADTTLQADAYRDALTNIFAPTNDPLRLRITKKDGSERQIDCYLDGQIDYPMSSRIGASHAVVVPLVAPEPAFYNRFLWFQEVMMPTSPVEIAITMTGCTWDDWPLFSVTGPITNFQIEHLVNTTSIDTLTLIGDIPAGELWEFNLRPQYKTLWKKVGSVGYNRMAYLDIATIGAFATMRVLSDKSARAYNTAAVSNRFVFTGSGLSATSKVIMYYYRRYLSL